MEIITDIRVPPKFCQYVDAPCDQDFSGLGRHDAFFVYPSRPETIAGTIDAAISLLRGSGKDIVSWKDLHVAGQIIFCEICKAARAATTVVADVSTLNFNLMFEVGFAIGLRLPLIPIRDSNYVRDQREFEELGVLDTIGYVDFRNSEDLATSLAGKLPGSTLPALPEKHFDEPIYALKGRIEPEGALRLFGALKKSGLFFRTYDPLETTRLSLGELRRQVSGSLGVIAHLLSPNREGSLVHNALCALACGLATAQEKAVVLVQEEMVPQPVDYRDIVRPYTNPEQIPGILEPFVREIVARMQVHRPRTKTREGLLERLDLGDPAAENEIGGLKSYFVKTGQFTQAKQGHARLVVGRKGTGKTAIFYGVRDLAKGVRNTVIDMKPEGHQFTRLKETVLASMSPGLQEHTMTAFWNYVLLTEFARKILYEDEHLAFRDPKRKELFDEVKRAHAAFELGRDQDFSQRLLYQVDKVRQLLVGVPETQLAGRVTHELYAETIHTLGDSITAWLREKGTCWLLIDNIDKGWPTRGTSSTDITIVRSLLDAVRKLQKQFQSREVELKCLVFLRSDIYVHLLRETPDRGKDTAIVLEWEGPSTFGEMVRSRIAESIEEDGSFDDIWGRCFEPLVGSQNSFLYVSERTLMRPRDLLQFLQRSLEVAINKKHDRVTADYIKQAERSYSEDLLLSTAFEIGDTYPQFSNVLYHFEHQPTVLNAVQVRELIEAAGVPGDQVTLAIDLLLWFGFLGVQTGPSEAKFSYDVRHNVERLKAYVATSGGEYTVHPAFHAALA